MTTALDNAADEPNVRHVTSKVYALARELQTLAREIDTLADDEGAADLAIAKQVRAYLQARRRREQMFPAELFADPAWEMMLDLFLQELEGKPVSVSSACVAANVPSSTALRWITHLQEAGIMTRVADVQDRRRCFVHLSPAARQKMRQWVKETFLV